MLVYGDAERCERPPAKIASIRDALAASAMAHGMVRHGWMVAALIESGELTQGLADHSFALRGLDRRCETDDAAMALTVALAARVERSWSSGFADRDGSGDDLQPLLDRLASMPLPFLITVKRPEGFAYYALYPEAYIEAARDAAQAGPVHVIGIRSIGTTLAACVAVSCGAAGLPATLRPTGHPFGRHVAVAAEDAVGFAPDPEATYAVADEGPGLSGSSFAAVAGFLERQGVAKQRIHLFPSHDGEPGPQASPEIRQAWPRLARHVRTFDDLCLADCRPEHRLANWVSDLIGKPEGQIADLSGGAWRRHRPFAPDEWPPVHAGQERRKCLLRTESGAWLLKFAGLGRAGMAKLDRGRVLAEAGFTPKPAGWRHGFLVEPWYGDAMMPDFSRDRAARLERVGAYLGFRAKSFPAAAQGASVEALFAMARHNVGEALGEHAASWIDGRRPDLARLEATRRPIETDNRLHRWEWLDWQGRLIKTDALDHHAGHDLVGAQDIAWDVAGAAIELGFSEAETEHLAALAESAGQVSIDPGLLSFCRLCYLAFQLGSYSMAKEAASCLHEAARLEAARRRYADLLATHVEH